MRALFWLLAVFAVAVALVILGRVGAGYVMFVYPPYRVELSLLFFVVASLAGFLLLYAAMRLLGHAVSLPTYVRAYRSRRRRERAHAALAAALQAYYEGRYARAEKEAGAAFAPSAAPAPGTRCCASPPSSPSAMPSRRRWLRNTKYRRTSSCCGARQATRERSSGAGAASRRPTSCSRASLPRRRAMPPRSEKPGSPATSWKRRSPRSGLRSSLLSMATCRRISSPRSAPPKPGRASSGASAGYSSTSATRSS